MHATDFQSHDNISIASKVPGVLGAMFSCAFKRDEVMNVLFMRCACQAVVFPNSMFSRHS
jgi:hypothetical protein